MSSISLIINQIFRRGMRGPGYEFVYTIAAINLGVLTVWIDEPRAQTHRKNMDVTREVTNR